MPCVFLHALHRRMPIIDTMFSLHKKRLPRILLLLSMIALPLLTLTQAENRHLIPEENRQELSDFYRYLRTRYGKAPEERRSETPPPLVPSVEKPRAEVPEHRQEAQRRAEDSDSKATNTQKPSEQKGTSTEQPAEKKPAERKQVLKKNTSEKPREDRTSQEKPEDEIELVAMSDTVELPEPRNNRSFAKAAPSFYRGLYINNALVRGKGFANFLKTADNHGINVLVIDIQPHMPPAEALKLAEDMGFYLVARVVVFDAGLKTYPAPKGHIERIVNRAEEGAKAGFAEIQLDYIRFADNLRVKGLTVQKRYDYISSVLSQFERRLRPYKVRIGADIFGRIAFNRDDIIGQKLELFDRHMDVIYPMLYPSHFYGDPIRRRKPYHTIFDGTLGSKKRVRNARIVPYIQAFGMRVGESGLSVENYIRAQLDAAQDSGGAGYVAWNARNDYSVFFRAIRSGRFMPAVKTKR
ncbi:MAG: glycosyl hydrolase [Leptonema illini]|uniref:Glycosyl hydrolase n=1 Tax=Leptonema illini TaxID=183 RepID=A0A833H2I9_9LEPT|nr:MAG: glycosyl hydrolase [Leptonema illini]